MSKNSKNKYNKTSSTDNFQENIQKISLVNEVSDSYLNYALSVIVSRAIPDLRDGLKPVQRRILFSMYENDFEHNKPHKKSARIVGDVIAQYHPHGDSSIYDAMVRLARDFSMSSVLIDGQGNFGSIDNDPPAAMRYTEARLSKLSSKYILADLKKPCVDMVPNYDKSTQEPTILPCVFPNILVNGSNGIAVGMASNIPPHNLHEVIDSCCAYIDNPDITVDEIMDIMPGPDFPTGGIIASRNKIKNIYETGVGTINIKCKYEIVEQDNKNIALITEIPFQANKAAIIEQIADIIRLKKIDGIANVRDDSDRHGISIMIEFKNKYNPEILMNNILSMTSLQSGVYVNMLTIHEDKPKVLPIIDIIKNYVEFRVESVRRRSIFEINKLLDRAKHLIGLVLISKEVDKIIESIKSSSNYNEAKDALLSMEWSVEEIDNIDFIVPDPSKRKRYKLSEKQAEGILNLKLHKLTKLEINNMIDEFNMLVPSIRSLTEIINNKAQMLDIIKTEMLNIKDDISAPRRSQISNLDISRNSCEIPIEDIQVIISITKLGYIKSIPIDEYRVQKRGGRGKMSMQNSSNMNNDINEEILTTITCNARDILLCISSFGYAYCVPAYKINMLKANTKSKGVTLNNIINIKDHNEKIIQCIVIPKEQDKSDTRTIVFVTSDGYIRKNRISDFYNISSRGKIALRLEDDVKLVSCTICNDNDEIIIVTENGKCARFSTESVRLLNTRTGKGVKAVKCINDKVIFADVIDPSCEHYLASITDDGLAKRTKLSEYRLTNRNVVGITVHDTSRKGGKHVKLASAFIMDASKLSSSSVVVVTDQHRVLRFTADSILTRARVCKGVIIIKPDQKTTERIVSANIIVNDSDEDEE